MTREFISLELAGNALDIQNYALPSRPQGPLLQIILISSTPSVRRKRPVVSPAYAYSPTEPTQER